MPDKTLGMRLCGVLPGPCPDGRAKNAGGPCACAHSVSASCCVLRCRCMSVLSFCVVSLCCLFVVRLRCVWVACLCRVCELCVCVCVAFLCRVSALRVCAVSVRCVSVSCVCVVCLHVRKGHFVVPRSLVDARVLVGRIIAGLRAPPRAGRPRQGRKVSVHEVCQRVVGWSIPPPNRDSSHPTAKYRGGKGAPQGSAAALTVEPRTNNSAFQLPRGLKHRDTIVFIQQPLLCPSPARRAAARERRSVRKFNFVESTFQECGIRVERKLASWPALALRRFQFSFFLLNPTICCFLLVCVCSLVLILMLGVVC